MIQRRCLRCGMACKTTYCPAHRPTKAANAARGYGAEYVRNRRIVLANASVCALCGLAPTPGDPLTADHIRPAIGYRRLGLAVDSSLSNLRAVHRSCNSSRGAKT